MAGRIAAVAGCIALVGICGAGAVFLGKKLKNNAGKDVDSSIVITLDSQQASASTFADGQGPTCVDDPEGGILIDSPTATLLNQAEALATGYDYDGAIALLQSDPQLASDPAITNAIANYEAIKGTLVRSHVGEITHVFFHSLVVDNSKAFDGDDDEKGYNQVRTTVGEFKKILQNMYDKGYVLVRLHDLAYETTDESGNTVMKAGDIMLPEGKTAFVMSQDDLCYYPYMTGDGFATRMVIGEDGRCV